MTGWALIAAALLAQPFLNDQKPPPPSLLSLEWRHRPDSNRGGICSPSNASHFYDWNVDRSRREMHSVSTPSAPQARMCGDSEMP